MLTLNRKYVAIAFVHLSQFTLSLSHGLTQVFWFHRPYDVFLHPTQGTQNTWG